MVRGDESCVADFGLDCVVLDCASVTAGSAKAVAKTANVRAERMCPPG